MNDAQSLFHNTYGRPAAGLYSAPGRVNLIGEHTDYNNGLVLPFAIDARCFVAAAPNDDSVVRVTSAQRPGQPVELPIADLRPGAQGHDWSSYLFGMFWGLTEAGSELGGIDIALDSQVPVGAGLSSSAAVECATGLAMLSQSGMALPATDLARSAQRAENDYVGMPCGLMDQMASATCRAGNVLFFDVGADTTENIPFDTAATGLSVLVIDTKAHHSLADGEYAKRREACEQAAAELGLSSLRDIAFDGLDAALARLDDDVLRRRVRHIVTENARVEAVVARLRSGAVADIGPDLTASHVSLRDDYEVSCEELDVAVDAALSAGALGARMTGGGFGGSVVALVPDAAADEVQAAVEDAFAARSLTAPVTRAVAPADGARVE